MSVFALPLIQCSFNNLRVMYCFVPFIVITLLLVIDAVRSHRKVYLTFMILTSFAPVCLGHETSNLYYFNWRVKEQDRIHMENIATDLWRKYGRTITKPVAIIGGWEYYPNCWEAMRPFAYLPLVNHPFPTYSNVTSHNVPREFYMIAREKVGLVLKMPEARIYEAIKNNNELLRSAAYPSDGYVFEFNDVVVVNLGDPKDQKWPEYKWEDYYSPNEKLLAKVLHLDKIRVMITNFACKIKEYSKRFAWAL